MGGLHDFLEICYDNSLNWRNFDEIHVVMGNEAGDLDSVMSTFGYAHFLHSTINRTEGGKKIAILPVLNFDREGMEIRLEHRYLFESAQINLDKLIYRNQVNFEEMVQEFRNSNKTLVTYLVDHHKLREKDEVLKETVCRIFDHRPLDKYYCWTDHNLKMRLESVASCCTLIADELFKEEQYEVDSTLAYLMFCTIVYDTKGFQNPGTLDEIMKTLLNAKSNHRANQKEVYKKLDELHARFDHLTPTQILERDLKFENGILFPRLSMLSSDFLKLENAYEAIEDMCHRYKSHLAVIIGTRKISHGQVVDVGVLFSDLSVEYRKTFTKKFEDARFVGVTGEYENFIIFKFLGERMGRKKILPLVLEICEGISEA